MWKIIKVEADNFMSFDRVSFDFKDKCYVVNAENKDNGGQKSNGGGKTSFIDIPAICLLGYSLTGRNTKDCVNWNSEKNYFTVKCEMLHSENNSVATIERKFYSNTKSSELIIIVDGELPHTVPSKKGVVNGVDVKEGNKYILNNILGINEEDLLNYFFISRKHYQPFLQVNTDRKLEVIARFTNTSVVDAAIEGVENEHESQKSHIDQLERSITAAEGYIEALRNSVGDDQLSAWEEDKKVEIERIQNEILAIEESIYRHDETIEKHAAECDAISFHVIDEDVEQQLVEKREFLNTPELLILRQDIATDLLAAKNYFAGMISCPKCKHEFNVVSEKKFKPGDVEELEGQLTEVDEEIIIMNNEISAISDSIREIEEKKRENRSREKERDAGLRIIASLEKQKERLMADIEKKFLALDAIMATTFEDKRGVVLNQIKAKEKEIEGSRAEIANASVSLDFIGGWVDKFNDFKFYLGNKPLELICSLVNQYLELNGSDLSLQIEGFKKLKSGEIRQSLTPMIYRNWMNPKEYNSFSEGEKVRLNIAVDLAFQQLINSASPTGGLAFYANDELLSACDSLGVANAADSLNILGKTILLVTHSGSDMQYKNTITIEKKDGISTIIS